MQSCTSQAPTENKFLDNKTYSESDFIESSFTASEVSILSPPLTTPTSDKSALFARGDVLNLL